ncbi:PAS domain S-box protein [Deinococcus cellulosilyticus]|uniref:Uncharacterized protein n=1 Tax=Deinococcus cellulosilyticus (strain DSM 18568 / NBRC 106333 / KACC 11606 / 5516J-15) TaxID=1223518 RepID=A0A511N1G2_DEIC1|nr:PAS domain S-box protein [Deinococcus cellulosilyticus]GEM46298.1 hypothetical protein DC3_19330 [Deinococcus cellulosilyticus NBRC 106333 = KACC 11606]
MPDASIHNQMSLFRALMHHTTDAIVLMDAQGRLLEHNAVVEQHLQRSGRSGLTQMNVLEMVHPEDHTVIQQYGLRPQLHGIPMPMPPFRVQDGEGKWLWFEGTTVNLLNDPQIRGILLTVRDVSHRVLMEQRTRSLLQLTHALSSVQTTEEVVQVMLIQGMEAMGARAGSVMWTDVPRGQIEILGSMGYPENLEKPWRRFPLAAPTPAGDAIRNGHDLFLSTDDWAIQYPHMQHIEGAESSSHAVLSLQVEGQTLGALTLSYDGNQAFSETERQFLRDMALRCAEALQRAMLHSRLEGQERRYRKLTEHSHDIVGIMDVQGNMQFVSPSIESILGYSPEDLNQRSAFQDVHPDDLATMVQVFQQALMNPGQMVQATYRFRHKDGHWVWLETSGMFSDVDADLDGVVINSRDVTARIETERLIEQQRTAHLHDLQASREETLKAMGVMLEYRNYETKGHTDRVVQLSERLGRVLGFDGDALDALRWGAYLHDTGKISIPDHILLKPAKLDADEWAIMKRHTVIGFELLKNIPTLPQLTLDVVLYHHERWDGTGYPGALAGDKIPLAARAFALIDVYDALTDERPYKRAWSKAEALAEILRTSGSHFDPELAHIFVDLMSGE